MMLELKGSSEVEAFEEELYQITDGPRTILSMKLIWVDIKTDHNILQRDILIHSERALNYTI